MLQAFETDVSVAEALKRALRALAKAVVLIACRSGTGERFVMPATAVTPVSMEPPSMLICVNRNVSSYPALAEGAGFSISILAEEQQTIAELCTGAAGRDRRFSVGRWREAADGTPYLDDALASIVCIQAHRLPFGTHDVIFGVAREVVVNAVHAPLIYADGRYQRLAAPAA